MAYVFEINGTNKIEITEDELSTSDSVQLSPSTLHLLKHHKGYDIEWLNHEAKSNEYHLRVNGLTYVVQVKDSVDQMVDELGMMDALEKKGGDIQAPMPGKVLEILVTKNQEVEAGTPLMILEAMKMENVLKATAPGTVASIEAIAGATVQKNDLLIKMS